jgi:hypothetical protein
MKMSIYAKMEARIEWVALLDRPDHLLNIVHRLIQTNKNGPVKASLVVPLNLQILINNRFSTG